MRTPTFARTLTAVVVLAALGLGIAIFVLSARGQDDGSSTVTTPTRTAQETSDFLNAAAATAAVDRLAVADDLVKSAVSVSSFPRVETNASVGRPMTFGAAIAEADTVITGRVQDQVLEWDVDLSTGERSLVIASLFAIDGVAVSPRVRERVELAYVPDDKSPGQYVRVLAYDAEEPLHSGREYAVIVKRSKSTDEFDLIYGHAYEIGADGRLTPVLDLPEESPAKDLSVAELERAVQDGAIQ